MSPIFQSRKEMFSWEEHYVEITYKELWIQDTKERQVLCQTLNARKT